MVAESMALERRVAWKREVGDPSGAEWRSHRYKKSSQHLTKTGGHGHWAAAG